MKKDSSFLHKLDRELFDLLDPDESESFLDEASASESPDSADAENSDDCFLPRLGSMEDLSELPDDFPDALQEAFLDDSDDSHDTSPPTEIDGTYWYTDEDIRAVLNASCAKKNIQYVPGNSYLLQRKVSGKIVSRFRSNEDGKYYFTTLTPPVGALGTPVDYFLDKNMQQGGALTGMLKKLLDEHWNAIKDNTFDDLVPALKNIFSKADEGILGRVASEVVLANFNQEELRQKLKLLEKQDPCRDVFDEIMPMLKKRRSGHARIVFPLRMRAPHWVTSEIVIHLRQATYDVQVMVHDPYGKGIMSKQHFRQIKEAVKKRISECAGGEKSVKINVKSIESTFLPRQHEDDGAICGVVIPEDVIRRLMGTRLRKSRYPIGAFLLRHEQADLVINMTAANTTLMIANFVERVGLDVNLVNPHRGESHVTDSAERHQQAVTRIASSFTPLLPSVVQRPPSLTSDLFEKATRLQKKAVTSVRGKRTQKKASESDLVSTDLFTKNVIRPFVKNAFTGDVQSGYLDDRGDFIYIVPASLEKMLQNGALNMKGLFEYCVARLKDKLAGRAPNKMRLILLSPITSPLPHRKVAYTALLFEFYLQPETFQCRLAGIMVSDPLHRKTCPQRSPITFLPAYCQRFISDHKDMTMFLTLGTRSTRHALIMSLYALHVYAFDHEPASAMSLKCKEWLVKKALPWETIVAPALTSCGLLTIEKNNNCEYARSTFGVSRSSFFEAIHDEDHPPSKGGTKSKHPDRIDEDEKAEKPSASSKRMKRH